MPTEQETVPPQEMNMSEILRAVQEQTAAIENLTGLLHEDLSEIKHLLALTPVYPMGYHVSQANYGGQMQGVVHGRNTNVLKQKRGKPKPPFVPKGQGVICIRCQYAWTPQSRHPQKCPNCRSPWWYPAKYRWRKNRDAENGASGGATETGKEQG